jgi:hypothetical protein
MKEPRRWLDDARDLSALERRALAAAERVTAPEGSKRQVWMALSAALPLAPPLPEVSPLPSSDAAGLAGAAGTGSAAELGSVTVGTKTVLAVSALKAVGVGFALGAAAVGGSTWLGSSTEGRVSAPPPAVSTTRNAAPASERPMQARPPLPEPLPATSMEARLLSPSRAGAAPSPLPSATAHVERVEPGAARAAFPDAPAPVVTAPPIAGAVAPALDRARLESQRVAEARRALRTGNPRAALALLESVVREFPNGVLVQEREALSIDALLSCGERAAARARALDFVTRYPGSPHTLAVRRALE